MNHVTQVKLALRDLIIDKLPELLRAADLDADDGVTCESPQSVYRTDKNIEAFPSVVLIVTDSRPDGDSQAQIYRHRIVIGFTLAGDDEQVLTTQVERYMWCLRNLTRDRLIPPAGLGPIDTGGEMYTPLSRERPKGLEVPFVKGGFIELAVRTLE